MDAFLRRLAGWQAANPDIADDIKGSKVTYGEDTVVDPVTRKKRIKDTATSAELAAQGIFPTTEEGEQPTKVPTPDELAAEGMEGKVVKMGDINYDQMAARAMERPGYKDHGITVTYDPETGEFVEDYAAFGFGEDQRYKRFSPDEWFTKTNLDPNKFKVEPTPAEGAKAGPGTDEVVTEAETKEAKDQADIKASTYKEIKAGLYDEPVYAEDGTMTSPGKFIGTPAQAEAALRNYDTRSNASPDEIRELTEKMEEEEITEEEIQDRLAKKEKYIISDDAFVDPITGERPPVEPTEEAERSKRAILTDEAAQKEAAKIPLNEISWKAAKRDKVKGKDAKGEAAKMLQIIAPIPEDVVSDYLEDPKKVEAQRDDLPVEVAAAMTELPTEYLVSAQMKSLTSDLQDGTVPLWARPAVDAINQRMAERGLEVSTVGRDALFNAVITQALPLAQGNAEALQANFAQRLSYEQQSNIEEARLDMSRRMENLANEQRAESESARFAQNMKESREQFKQQATMATAAQKQQVLMQDFENRQEVARVNAQNEQQINSQELSAAAQIDLAELRAEEARVGADQSAENQRRLSEFQTAADFMAKNAGFTQQMRMANMSEDNQMRLANLASRNQAASELMSNDEKIELANLNSRMQTNLLEGRLASEMGVAQLNVDQQRAVQNAAMIANVDMTKYTTQQQVELVNSKWMQTASLTNLNNRQQAAVQNATAMASLDMAAVDQRTQVSITNARNFLSWDTANLTNSQQANMLQAQMDQQALLSDQAAGNAAQQFNSTSENQTNQFVANLGQQIEINNASRFDAMEQFNANSQNAAEARRAARDADIEKFNASMLQDINKYNDTITFQRDTWNAQNSAAVEAGNVSWRRRANEIDTATNNAVNMQNAMNAFKMSSQASAFLWQELRDQADFDFRHYESDQQRRAAVIISALGNMGEAYKETFWESNFSRIINTALGKVG